MAVTVDDVVIAIKADTGKAVKNLDRLESQLDEVTMSLVKQTKATEKNNKAFASAGASIIKINQAAELAARAFAGLSRAFDMTFASAVQLEKGVAEVATLLSGDTVAASQQLTKEILALQREFGTDQADLAKAFYQSISSGAVDASNAQGLLISAQKLAIGGVTTLATATDGLTSLMNAYGVSADEAATVSDALFIGMRAGKTTVGELSGTLGQAASLAASTGVSFQELVSAVSAVTTGGVQTSAAVTQVRSAIVGLSKQTPQLTAILEKLGVTSIKAAVESDGLVGVLKRIVGETDGSTEALTELFGRIEAVNAILALTSGEIGGKFENIMNDMAVAATQAGAQTEEAFKKMVETADFRLAVLQGRASAAFTELGQTLLPPVITSMEFFVDVVGDVVDVGSDLASVFDSIDFDDLLNNSQALIPIIGGLATTFALLNKQVFILKGQAMAQVFIAWGTAAAAAAIPTAIIAAKAIAIAAGVVAIGVAFDLLVRNTPMVADFFKTLFLTISQLAQTAQIGILVVLEKVGLASKTSVQSAKKALAETEREIAATSKRISSREFDFGFAGAVGRQISNFFSDIEEGSDHINNQQEETKKTLEEIRKEKERQLKLSEKQIKLLADQAKALADIKKSNADLRLELESIDAGFADRLQLQLQSDLAQVNAQEMKLAKAKLLTGEAKRQLDIQRDLLGAIAQADLAGAQSAALDSVIAKNEKIQSQIDAIGTFEFERINFKLQSDLLEIENMRTKLDLEGKLTAESNARLDKQRALVEQLAQKSVTQSLFGDFGARFFSVKAMSKIGSALGIAASKEIRKATPGADAKGKSGNKGIKVPIEPEIDEGALESMGSSFLALGETIGMAMTAALGPVGLILKAIEMLMNLPKTLSNAAGFLDGLVSLPENLIAASEKLGDSIVNFFRKLPGLIPALGKALLKMIFEITKAIVVGIVDFLKIAINDILNFFGFDDFFNVGKAEERLQKFVKNISGSTSKLFEVVADAEEVRGIERAKQLEDAIVGAARKSEDILDKFFRKMGEFGTDIWKGFIQPVLNWFGDRGTDIWNSFKPAMNWFGDRGTEIWNGLKTAVGDVATVFGKWGTAIWNGLLHFLENPGEALGNLGTQIWDGFKSAATAIGDLGTDIWNGLKSAATTIGDLGTAIWNGLSDASIVIWDFGRRIWVGFVEAIGDLAAVFGKWGTEIWKGLKQFVDDPGDAFKSLGGQIAEGFKSGLSGITESLKKAGMTIFEGFEIALQGVNSIFKKIFDSSGGLGKKGGVETALNIDVPFASFNQGGIIPGRPVVNGDSALNDRVVALMSPGEGVIPRTKMQDPIIRRFFEMIMQGKIGQNSFAFGGITGSEGIGLNLGGGFIGSRPTPSNPTFNFNINIELNNEGDDIDESFVRSRIMPVMQDELRRSSLNGDFVIDERGIRNG